MAADAALVVVDVLDRGLGRLAVLGEGHRAGLEVEQAERDRRAASPCSRCRARRTRRRRRRGARRRCRRAGDRRRRCVARRRTRRRAERAPRCGELTPIQFLVTFMCSPHSWWRSGGRRDGGLAEVAGSQQVAPAAQVGRRALEHEPAVAEDVGAVGDLEGERDVLLDEQDAARRARPPRGAGSAAGARRSRAPGRGSSRRRAGRAGRRPARGPTASICCSPPESTPALRSRHLRSSGSSSSSASRRDAALGLGQPQVLARRSGRRTATGPRARARRRGGRACAPARRRRRRPSSCDAAADAGQQAGDRRSAWSSCRRRWARAARRPRPAPTCEAQVADDRRAVVARVEPRRGAAVARQACASSSWLPR